MTENDDKIEVKITISAKSLQRLLADKRLWTERDVYLSSKDNEYRPGNATVIVRALELYIAKSNQSVEHRLSKCTTCKINI